MLYRRHLLPISVLALLALLITLIPVYPNDLWWHMRSGEEIVQGRPIPTIDTYSFTGYGRAFVYSGWASQALLYLLHYLGGASLLVVARNVLVTGAYLLALVGAAKRSQSWLVAALLILWSGLFSVEFWHIRPQIFGYLPFVALLFVMLGFADGRLRARWLLAAPLATIIWTNVHGAFTLAPIIATLIAGSVTLQWLKQRDRRSGVRSVMLLWTTVAGVALAMLVNPWGFGITDSVRTLLTDQAIQMFVVEWQPPHPGGIFRNLFFSSILLSIAAFGLSRRRPTLAEIFVFGALVWQAWTASRFIVWYGLAWPMLVAPSVAGLLPQARSRRPTPEIGWLNLGLALALIGLPLSQQPGSPFRRWLPDAYRAALIAEPGGEPLLIKSTPVGAVAYLQAHPLPANARLFNETGAGSYLIWAWRDGRVFVDPRYTTQPLQVWLDYRQIVTGCGYNTLLGRYAITHALVDQQEQRGLAAALAADTGWRGLWSDASSALYERTDAPPSEPPCQPAPANSEQQHSG
ncbi:MAG: hypothetical protein CYG59_21470 [Chloroflexi bacterium]|nr:MAG: hypothetical protein CYG59_21470 [Chloroflexota bacterium]